MISVTESLMLITFQQPLTAPVWHLTCSQSRESCAISSTVTSMRSSNKTTLSRRKNHPAFVINVLIEQAPISNILLVHSRPYAEYRESASFKEVSPILKL